MLHIEQLQVDYGESRIISNLNLDVPQGGVVCLMGRNGVGKTTLLKAIMGLLKPRHGKITFDGQDVTGRLSSQRARAGIGYVPQGRGIFPYLTVHENLLMGFEALTPPRPDPEALDRTYTLFPALRCMSQRAAGTLSGGQQQQLAIGRALVRRPKLLLLDEPTEGIQPSIMLEIERVMLSLRSQGEMTILLVEQFLDFALSVATHYFIMDTGTIVAEGPVGAFNPAVAREYLAL